MENTTILAKGLIIDDDKSVHEILTEGLADYCFLSAYGIDDAKLLIQSESYSFVLLDYRLGTNQVGLSLVSMIRQHQPLALIALMSAYGTPFVLKEAIESSIDTFFDKPIILNLYKQKLSDLLSKKGLLQDVSVSKSVVHIEELLKHEKYDASKVNLKQYARQTNKNYKYLSQKFKKDIGKTFQQVKKEEKYAQIKQLLTCTSLSIKKISEQTGFANPSAIMRGFKDFTGVTMMEFRRKHQ